MWKVNFIVLSVFLSLTIQAQTCKDTIPATTPDNRFTIYENNTVTDNKTNLMWKRCLQGQEGVDCNIGSIKGFTWSNALQMAEQDKFAGFSDWRVPNIKELGSIVERRCYDPAINLVVFPNSTSSYVWSSSPFPNTSLVLDPQWSSAWYIKFNDGFSNGGQKYKRSDRYVRLVRDISY